MKTTEARKIAKKHARKIVDETEECHGLILELDSKGKHVFVLCAEKKCKSHDKMKELEGVPVVVREMDKMQAFQTRTEKWRPAPGGVSIGHIDITAGTLGCSVIKTGTKYILSNNHVLADCNDADLGDNILQPGPVDGGANPADKIGELHSFTPIVFNDDTELDNVDCALCLPTDEDDVEDILLELGGTPTHYTEAYFGMPVAKSGRTTAITRGYIIGFYTGWVGYAPGKDAWYTDQPVTTPGFGAGGDSGSIVVVDPFVSIAYVPGTGKIIILESTAICRTCCSYVTPPGEVECTACGFAGENTPPYLRVKFSGVEPCDICMEVGGGKSCKITELNFQALRYKSKIKDAVGLLFAGSAAGHVIMNPMLEVKDALGFDLEAWATESVPVDFYLIHGPDCEWFPYTSTGLFQGDFGTILTYDNNDCSGEATEHTLDRLEVRITQWWDGALLIAEIEGWVVSSTFAFLDPVPFFWTKEGGEIAPCGGIGNWENRFECGNPPGTLVGGGSITINGATWPEAFEAWGKGDNAEPTPPAIPKKGEAPNIEQMKADYERARTGMARNGRQAISQELYLEHRKICIECNGGYSCPHYCCGIQAQLATAEWRCKEGKY